MTYLLDTSTCISLLRAKDLNRDSVISALTSYRKELIYLCSIVKAELWVGAEKSTHRLNVQKALRIFFNEFESVPFDDDAAFQYGVIRGVLEKSGLTVGAHDLMIAATALSRDLIVVTHNIKDFSKVPGLKLDNWSKA